MQIWGKSIPEKVTCKISSLFPRLFFNFGCLCHFFTRRWKLIKQEQRCMMKDWLCVMNISMLDLIPKPTQQNLCNGKDMSCNSGQTRCDSLWGRKFLYSKMSRLALCSTHPPIQCTSARVFLQVELPGTEDGHLPPSNDEEKNRIKGLYLKFLIRLHSVQRDNNMFILTRNNLLLFDKTKEIDYDIKK